MQPRTPLHKKVAEMPQGKPTPQEILDDEVTFFSLDTDVIQAAGYNFGKGALNQLPRQLPRSMKLQLTELVLKEIVGHKLESVKEAADKFHSATAGLQRLTSLDFAPARTHVAQLNVLAAAEQKFDDEVRQYVTQCRGEVLPIADVDPEVLFAKYFATQPPFGLKAEKKSEFPDAAALLLLEQRAEDLKTKAIVASKDAGWKGFAEKSERLYCVTSLDDLAALFTDTGAHANAVKDKITAAVNDEDSALRTQLTEALKVHIADADWDTNELYSASHRFEAEIASAELTEYSVDADSINVWKVDDEPGAWVIELSTSVKADVTASAQFFVWDSIDREELAFGGEQFTFSAEVDVEAYLTCYDVKLDAAPETWHIEVEIGSGKYGLEAAEIELDLSDED
jgi:hypothetical protein